MKIIRNNIIPFKGFAVINLFGILFVRKDAVITEQTLLHEEIHTAQMKELLYVGFYILYVCYWIVNLFRCKFNSHAAYRSICFETEARVYSSYKNYLKYRQKFAWIDL